MALLIGGLVVGFGSLRMERSNGGSAAMVKVNQPMRPVLLVVDGADPANPKVARRIEQIIDERRSEGYDVIASTAGDANLRNLLNQWWHDKAGPADEALEDIMEAKNAYGILHVTIQGDSRRPVKNVTEELVHSTRPGADSRQRLAVETIVPAGPAPALPYLIINDHPAKIDPRVEAVVAQVIEAYKARGWMLEASDDVEVEVRKLLPPGKVDAAEALPPMLRSVLEDHGMGGVLRIDAMPGEGAPQERVMVTIVKAEDIRESDLVTDADTLPSPPEPPTPDVPVQPVPAKQPG